MTPPRKLVSIGNYRLDPVNLGKGTFASVELATHTIVRKKVALKIIMKNGIDDNYVLKNLHREASILSKLDHPNIVKLVEVCASKDIYCLVLEHIPNGTLFDLVHDQGKLPEVRAKIVCRQIVAAVDYLHGRKVLHRDLKLENILMDGGDRIVLIDFGLSSAGWYQGKIMKTHCGSPEYAAPELFWKFEHYGPGVDVWSFGVVLYGMVLGHLPFKTPSSYGCEISDAPSNLLIKVIAHGLTQDHFREMNGLNINLRVLLARCLDTNLNTRIDVRGIAADPWLVTARDKPWTGQQHQLSQQERWKILKGIQSRMNIRLPVEEILNHLERRKFGTTAGIYNLMVLQHLSAKRTLASKSTFSDVKQDSGSTNAQSDGKMSFEILQKEKGAGGCSRRNQQGRCWTREKSSATKTANVVPRLKRVEDVPVDVARCKRVGRCDVPPRQLSVAGANVAWQGSENRWRPPQEPKRQRESIGKENVPVPRMVNDTSGNVDVGCWNSIKGLRGSHSHIR